MSEQFNSNGVGNADDQGPQGDGGPVNIDDPQGREGAERHSSEAGFWDDYTLLPCRDGKVRRAQSGSPAMVAGLPKGVVHGRDSGVPIDPQASAEGRVMRLKGYGNAICAPLAGKFIKCAFKVLKEMQHEK